MVRFGSFNALRDVALRFKPTGSKLASSETFVVGAGAGLITVCKLECGRLLNYRGFVIEIILAPSSSVQTRRCPWTILKRECKR
jgi:hypothetical protein